MVVHFLGVLEAKVEAYLRPGVAEAEEVVEVVLEVVEAAVEVVEAEEALEVVGVDEHLGVGLHQKRKNGRGRHVNQHRMSPQIFDLREIFLGQKELPLALLIFYLVSISLYHMRFTT